MVFLDDFPVFNLGDFLGSKIGQLDAALTCHGLVARQKRRQIFSQQTTP